MPKQRTNIYTEQNSFMIYMYVKLEQRIYMVCFGNIENGKNSQNGNKMGSSLINDITFIFCKQYLCF